MPKNGNDQDPLFPGQHSLTIEQRKGVMIADGLIWCAGCGQEEVNISMGHKECRFCRHPKLAEMKQDLIDRYVKAGLPVPDDFSAILGQDDSD